MVGSLLIAIWVPGGKLALSDFLRGYCRYQDFTLAGLKELRQTVCDRRVVAAALRLFS
jgi:hypothetical protein